MATSADVIAACTTAETSATAAATSATTCQGKWATETTFMNNAVAASSGSGDTYDALMVAYNTSWTTRDAMAAISTSLADANTLYTKIAAWDVMTLPKNAIIWSTEPSTTTVPSSLTWDVKDSPYKFYLKTGQTFPTTINIRGNGTTTFDSYLNSFGVGASINASLMIYATTLSSFTLQVDGSSTNVSKVWEQTATIAGTVSLIRLDFNIMLTSLSPTTQYLATIKLVKYGTTLGA